MKFPCSVLLLLLAITSYSQDSLSDIRFQRSYGDSLNELLNVDFFHADADDGYILTAANSKKGDLVHTYNDVWVTKLDAAYNVKWQMTFGSNEPDVPGGITPAIGGGYMLTCQVSGNGKDFTGTDSAQGFWLVKLDPSGNISWKKQFAGPYSTPAIVSNGKDAYYLASSSYDHAYGLHTSAGSRVYTDALIQKLDTAGNILWGHCFGSIEGELVSTLSATADGGIVCIADTYGAGGDVSGFIGAQDIWAIKVSASGELQWQKCLGTPMYDMASNVRELKDGSFLVTGSVNSDARLKPPDAYVAKLSNSGELLWQYSAGGAGNDVFYDALPTADGGMIMVGSSNSGNIPGHKGGSDVWVYRMDKDHHKLWERCYGGQYEDWGYTITSLKNGNFLVYGLTSSQDGDVQGRPSASVDAWLLEIIGNDVAHPVVPSFPFFNRAGRLFDPEFPRQLISVYPNPFRGRIVLEGLQDSKRYGVTLFNAIGQRIFSRTVSGNAIVELSVPNREKIYFLQVADLNNRRSLGSVKLLSR